MKVAGRLTIPLFILGGVVAAVVLAGGGHWREEAAGASLTGGARLVSQAATDHSTAPGIPALPATAAFPNCPPPSSIDFGQTVECSIDSPGEQDSFTFTGAADDEVLLRMGEVPDVYFGPEVRLYGPDGLLICEASDNWLADVLCTLTGNGTHTVVAGDRSGTYTGNYGLHVQRTNNPGNYTAMGFGDNVAGSVALPGEMDTYAFSGSTGDEVLLRMGEVPDVYFGPEVRLYGPDGLLICEASHYSLAEVQCTLTGNGTHTVLAGDQSGRRTGSYGLTLQCLTPPCGATPTDTPTPSHTPTPTNTPTPTATATPLACTPPFTPIVAGDSDCDAAPDIDEDGADPFQCGTRDKADPWDFYDVPAPTIANGGDMNNRDSAVNIIGDVLAVLEYSGTGAPPLPPCNSGPDGIPGTADDRCYDDDIDGDGYDDGIAYDRSVSTTGPWSGPPDGAISILTDVLLVLAQSGTGPCPSA